MNDLKEIGGFIVSADPFVQHDNSLSGNGTVNSPLSVVPGYNETVLFSGNIGAIGNVITLNEPFSAFQYIGFYIAPDKDNPAMSIYPTDSISTSRVALKGQWAYNYMQEVYVKLVPVANTSGLQYTYNSNTLIQYTHTTTALSIKQNDTAYLTSGSKMRLIGINRK